MAKVSQRANKTPKSDVELAEIKVEFAAWLATPKEFRKPATARGFAKKHGVHHVTLSGWKTSDDVVEEARKRIVAQAALKLPDVLHTLAKMAEAGNMEAIRIFIEDVIGWGPAERGA